MTFMQIKSMSLKAGDFRVFPHLAVDLHNSHAKSAYLQARKCPIFELERKHIPQVLAPRRPATPCILRDAFTQHPPNFQKALRTLHPPVSQRGVCALSTSAP